MGYLSDANWWMDLRELRNEMTHDYPDDSAEVAQTTAKLFICSQELIQYWNQLESKLAVLL